MKTKLIIAGIGNYIDAIATYILTQYYGFVELNPIMAYPLMRWPELIIVAKIIIVTSILLFAYHTKRQRYMNIFATFAALLYGSLGIYYIVFYLYVIF